MPGPVHIREVLPVVKLAHLIQFIEAHDPCRVESAFSVLCPGQLNLPPYLVVSSIMSDRTGVYRHREVIPATLASVRAWLGY